MLGPLMYLMYINKLPSVIGDFCVNPSHRDPEILQINEAKTSLTEYMTRSRGSPPSLTVTEEKQDDINPEITRLVEKVVTDSHVQSFAEGHSYGENPDFKLPFLLFRQNYLYYPVVLYLFV